MDTIALPYLFWVLCIAPTFGVALWDHLRRNNPLVKGKRYFFHLAGQVSLFVFTLAAASAEKINLFPKKLPSSASLICGAVFVAAVLLWVRLTWSRVQSPAKQRLRLFLPETPKEFLRWMPVAVMAGVGEECAYRGVAYGLLRLIGLTALWSLGLCTIAFTVCHAYQGWRSAVKIGVLALLSQAAVFLTGSLYLSIAVHTAYDLLVVWLVMQLLNRDATALIPLEATF